MNRTQEIMKEFINGKKNEKKATDIELIKLTERSETLGAAIWDAEQALEEMSSYEKHDRTKK